MEYMSQEGYDELVAELQHMVNVELPAVRDAIAEARDKGDLSENFEYHAAKREQGKLLSRISFKQKVLENARVIDKSRLKSDTVGLLSKIKITNRLLEKVREVFSKEWEEREEWFWTNRSIKEHTSDSALNDFFIWEIC